MFNNIIKVCKKNPQNEFGNTGPSYLQVKTPSQKLEYMFLMVPKGKDNF